MYQDFINSYISIASTLLSLGVAIFTLSAAFIVTKKSLLKEYQKQAEVGGMSLTIMRNIDSTKDFLKIMRIITKRSIVTIISSAIAFVFAILFNFIEIGYFVHLLAIPVVFGGFGAFSCLKNIFNWYKSQ